MRMTRTLLLAALASTLSCTSLDAPAPDAHVVAHPLSARANEVLQNLVCECGTTDGHWRENMGDGCATLWATQFGYRAGTRREREDVLAIAEATASRQAALVRGLAWDALLGDGGSPDAETLNGFPALLISGTLGGHGTHALLFELGMDRSDDLMGSGMERRQAAGLAAILAEMATMDADQADERLSTARELAEQAAGDQTQYPALAWCAIARASGAPEDLARAREAVAAMPYAFEPETGGLAPLEARHEVLSMHLTAVHALCDLVQATGEPAHHRMAAAILDYTFSDAYFDGRFLAHDLGFGMRSESFCSGCNFMALYLVDRLHGDAWVIDAVPPLPERDAPEVGGGPRPANHAATVAGFDGPGGFSFTSWTFEGTYSVDHQDVDAWIWFELASDGGGGISLHALLHDVDSDREVNADYRFVDEVATIADILETPRLSAEVTITRRGEKSFEVRVTTEARRL